MFPALLLAAALVADSSSSGRVVEVVIATVQASPTRAVRPLTLTRLREEARIALVSRGATDAAFGPLDGAALNSALEWVIDQTLIAEEADRLMVAEVGRDEAGQELRRFRGRFASPEEFSRYLSANDTAEDELLASLARSLRVQRFIEGRVGQSFKISDGEVDEYLRARGLGASPGVARDAVRSHLGEQRLAAEVRKMVADLRARATIRILVSPAEVVSD